MSDILTLNCLVLGEPAANIFEVKIQKSQTVSALREAIRDKKIHSFQHVDANKLILWKVSFPVNEDFARAISDFRFDGEGLSPMKKLSKLFLDEPEEENVHIIVRSSKITFACYFPAEKHRFFSINIESDAWVLELLKMVHTELQSHYSGQQFKKADLRLFKVTSFLLWKAAS